MAHYINIRNKKGEVETIDEFGTREEALKCLAEYRLVYQGSEYRVYHSLRSTKEWRQDNKEAGHE